MRIWWNIRICECWNIIIIFHVIEKYFLINSNQNTKKYLTFLVCTHSIISHISLSFIVFNSVLLKPWKIFIMLSHLTDFFSLIWLFYPSPKCLKTPLIFLLRHNNFWTKSHCVYKRFNVFNQAVNSNLTCSLFNYWKFIAASLSPLFCSLFYRLYTCMCILYLKYLHKNFYIKYFLSILAFICL